MDIYIDGASSGNPGDSGIGIVFLDNNETIKNISEYLGKQTNNFAEYSALVRALQEAHAMKVTRINIFSDSELLCRQIKGQYKVKSDNIKSLYQQASLLLHQFECFNIHHIPREQNSGADKLARMASKKKIPK